MPLNAIPSKLFSKFIRFVHTQTKYICLVRDGQKRNFNSPCLFSTRHVSHALHVGYTLVKHPRDCQNYYKHRGNCTRIFAARIFSHLEGLAEAVGLERRISSDVVCRRKISLVCGWRQFRSITPSNFLSKPRRSQWFSPRLTEVTNLEKISSQLSENNPNWLIFAASALFHYRRHRNVRRDRIGQSRI